MIMIKVYFICFIFFLFCSGLNAEVNQEDVKNDPPKTNLTDERDEPQTSDATGYSAQTENTRDDVSSQNLMDCRSAGDTDEAVLTCSKNNTVPTQCSNGQKSKRPSSPGPHPSKTTCVAAHNTKLHLCLSFSSKSPVCTPIDVEMLSPDSPVCKTMFNNSADQDCDGGFCAEHSAFAKAQVMESQQTIKDSDPGSSTKEREHLPAMGSEDAEIADHSGSSNMNQDLIESQPDAILQRSLERFSLQLFLCPSAIIFIMFFS